MQASSAVIRTPFGMGASHQRRLHSQMPMQMQVAWRVDNDNLDPLFQWLNQYGFDWFTIDLSGVESSRLNEFKSPIAIRLITDLNIALIHIHRQNWYIVSSSAEYYPPVVDRTYVVPVFFSISEGHHGHLADNLTLVTPNVILVINQATHAHTVDNLITTSSVTTLVITDGHHTHLADTALLNALVALAVADSTHAHATDPVALGNYFLPIQEAMHAHSTDPIALNTLKINEALHSHAADNLTLTPVP